jgi:hypothetical protein
VLLLLLLLLLLMMMMMMMMICAPVAAAIAEGVPAGKGAEGAENGAWAARRPDRRRRLRRAGPRRSPSHRTR